MQILNTKTNDISYGDVGIFFIVDKSLLLYTCTLSEAEKGGDFLNYPESHDDCWRRNYYNEYNVDYDYFPRGRIVFNLKSKLFIIYHDICVTNEIKNLYKNYAKARYELALDEHYQCHMCNLIYIE